jgi:predicted nucleic acid-binding protein
VVIEKARELHQIGLRSKDALHIACAIFVGCNYFLTTDDKIIDKNDLIDEIIITDPIGFIKEVY